MVRSHAVATFSFAAGGQRDNHPYARTTDDIDIGGSTTIQTSGIATIVQKTAGTAINLGGADAIGTLGLTDAELDNVVAPTLRIGNNNSGTITVSSNITRPQATNLVFQTAPTCLVQR